MNNATFVQNVQRNVNRVKEYKLGHDGSDGACDCIGLIIGAIRLAGEKWSGTHGSNYSARNEMRSLDRIPSANALSVGDIVYKAYEPGESGYNLPATYKNSNDQRDYYHVGVVTSVNPLVITHCTGVPGGIKKDTALGKWKYFGQLKKVTNDSPAPTPVPSGKAVVNDKAVAVRVGISKSTQILTRLPKGTVVDLVDVPSDWTCISANGVTGFMMTEFLDKGGQDNA